jgi:anti-anti-sigma factor
MTLHRHDEGEAVRLVVAGELDLTTAGRLERAVVEAERAAQPRLVLDLRDVGFFDSTGLQILLDADVRARERGRGLRIVAGTGEVARVLALTEVEARLDVVTDG